MASSIPASLKAADIGRFAVRAAQLEKAKPVVAYWCNFYIVNQIIERGLHTSDDETKLYTTNLVDKLETFKSENPDNDTVTDAIAASAYVEQFGLEVFGRAEATMRANKVTRQTADTFQAAATFLELLQIWNTPDPEIAAKIKFAKYHTLRIAKAIKAGEDPNATNPEIKNEEDELNPADNDPEVQAVMQSASEEASRSRQPSVEEVSDEPTPPFESTSAHPHVPSPPTGAPSAPAGQNMDISDDQDAPFTLPSAPETITSSSTSVPRLPDTPADIGAAHAHPGQPDNSFQSFPPPSTMPSPSPTMPPQDVRDFYNQPSVPPSPSQAPAPVPAPAPAPMMPPPARPSVPAALPRVPAGPTPNQTNPQSIDDDAIALAQKHARWAVSALSFDDVNTAIKELRTSLRHLGAE